MSHDIQHKSKPEPGLNAGEWDDVFGDIPTLDERKRIERAADRYLQSRGEVTDSFNRTPFKFGKFTTDISTEGVYADESDTE